MKKTRMAMALLTGLAAASGLPLSAFGQVGTPRAAVNPAHEDLKRDADLAYQKGDYNKVIQLCERVLGEAPQDHVALYLRGSARVEIGLASGDKALVRNGIADSREAIRLGGADNVSYYLPYLSGMTRLAAVEGRDEHAKVSEKVAGDLLERLTTLKPDDKANLLYQRGMTRIFLKNTEGALNDFQEAIKLNPTHLGAYVGTCEAHITAGVPGKAEEAYGAAVKAFPSNPLVYNNRGMFLQQVGKLDKAQEDFTRALELDPKYHFAYINRGFTLMAAGQPAAAEVDFSQALRLAPNQPAVYSLRATSRQLQGNMQAAVQDQMKVIELDPKNPVAHADLGFTRFFSQDYAGAVQSFNKAAELSPEVHYLAPWRYWALLQTGKTDAAKALLGESLKQKEHEWTNTVLAYLADSADPETLLATVAKSAPQYQPAQRCEAHFFMGLKAAQAGNAQKAADHFRQALETKAMHLSAYRGSQIALDRMKVARR